MYVELICELIKGEKTQREISNDLDVSIAKITRVSNALKIIDDKVKTFIKQHLINKRG
ncbi:Trp family transcriptional regulator [Candidatus Coxiella mudrowiae]|uniref:Trp family transcriptional regulator n=1 Tax=Candidatus Coxiella mudrowiae TaxID=2054173 RepID=UPI001F19B4A4|nr:Trp family transcriptional regulator [Candidatus Coxiella mudrowiae]